MTLSKILITAILFSMFFSLPGQDLVINEIMSLNDYFLEDEEGSDPDWIELYNNSDKTLNLGNYYLSDVARELMKFPLPDFMLPPGHFQLIYASGDSLIIPPEYWNTLINRGDVWKYTIYNTEPPSSWKQVYFNDESWSAGATGIGYGDNDDLTLIDSSVSVYFRKKFMIGDPSSLLEVILDIDTDDGFVAYLNGIEIARDNVSGIPPKYNTFANSQTEAKIINGKMPFRHILSQAQLGLIKRGENVLAVQVHNASSTSSDFSFIPFLSVSTNEPMPAARNETFLGLHTTEPLIHTNFSISSAGEWIFLSDSTGNWIDYSDKVTLLPDQSYGRKTDGDSAWVYYDAPSPGSSNNVSNTLFFSHERGFYTAAFHLKISDLRGGNIYYTLNGEIPSEQSALFPDSLLIEDCSNKDNMYSLIPTTQAPPVDVMVPWKVPKARTAKACILKCRTFSNGLPNSPVYTSTFFIDPLGPDRYSLPVYSLVLDSLDLFDFDSGIYVPGVNADTSWNRTGNFFERGREWEKPVSIEYFREDGSSAFNQDGGLRIHGQYSRRAAQKSLRLYARADYGKKYFDYPLLPKSDLTRYKRIILRSSMMTYGSMFGDAYIADLTRGMNFEFQDYQPVIVYLNGEYWGVHMMREYLDGNYLHSHYPDIHPDSVNLLRQKYEVMEGSYSEYQQLHNFLSSNWLNKPANYAYIDEQIDLDNYSDYLATELYMANRDWPGNNNIYWRPQDKSQKWRWILNDLDAGMKFPEYNKFEALLDSTSTKWPYQNWATLIYRRLIQNDDFRSSLICKSIKLMHTNFHPDTMIRRAAEYKEVFIPEMEEHILRWNYPDSIETWTAFYDSLIYKFALSRPEIFLDQMTVAYNISKEEIQNLCECNTLLPERDTIIIKSETESLQPSRLYPNPNNGTFSFESPSSLENGAQISIYTLLGQRVYYRMIEGQPFTVDIQMNKPAKGIYLLYIQGNQSSETRKFIVH